MPIYRRIAGSNYHPDSLVFATVAHTQVDDQFFAHLSQWRWFLKEHERKDRSLLQYAVRQEFDATGKKVHILLHRIVLELAGLDPGASPHHIDHDGLNNQLSNLSPGNSHRNQMSRVKSLGTSLYRGVNWNKSKRKWKARICLGDGSKRGKQLSLGYFSSEAEAARAYDAAARQHFGDRANPNFP